MKHCCDLMTDFISDPRVPIEYNARVRSYGLPLRQAPAIQGIIYCPWCGIKLPSRLRDEYYRIIIEELHLDPSPDVLETPGLPKEFKTDEWWKKRGL